MRLSSNGRYFEHNFPTDTAPHGPELFEVIDTAISEIEKRLIEHMEMQISSSRSDSGDKGIYSGDLGIIYAFYALGNPEWHKLLKLCISGGHNHRVTFLQSTMLASILRGNIEQVTGYADRVLRLDPSDCELLYGRAGCLHGLLFAKQRFPEWKQLDTYIANLAKEIIQAGSDSSRDYLMWKWHGKEYLGAIHGVAGILFILLLCGEDLLLKIDEDILGRIHQTIKFCMQHFRFEGGNIMSSTENDHDQLVHFCHGATGWIPLLSKMARLEYAESSYYLHLLDEIGGVVWQRGLIANKGPGICHGIGGSICGLIDIFASTGDVKWLHRAQWFSLYLSQNWKRLNPLADRPYSLFEGMCGAFYSLSTTHLVTSDRSKISNKNTTFCGFMM